MPTIQLEINTQDIIKEIDLEELRNKFLEDMIEDNPDWFVENLLKPILVSMNNAIIKEKCNDLIREYIKEIIEERDVDFIIQEAIGTKIETINILDVIRRRIENA